jgi:hypothetical protein
MSVVKAAGGFIPSLRRACGRIGRSPYRTASPEFGGVCNPGKSRFYRPVPTSTRWTSPAPHYVTSPLICEHQKRAPRVVKHVHPSG